MTEESMEEFKLRLREHERKWDRGRKKILEFRYAEWKHLINIVALASNEHDHPSLNEEYEKIATKYHNKEITREEFFEEFEMLKMAMKLIDE